MFLLCKVIYRCATYRRMLVIEHLTAAQRTPVRCAAVNRMKIERTLLCPLLLTLPHEEKC